mmetsp:Transcript_29901/g.59598  ORF Transcript_29901/g.59598 Transcript_29901/m.59598 type:complete len:88 (-) Transcript_29901:36-299(-)
MTATLLLLTSPTPTEPNELMKLSKMLPDICRVDNLRPLVAGAKAHDALGDRATAMATIILFMLGTNNNTLDTGLTVLIKYKPPQHDC